MSKVAIILALYAALVGTAAAGGTLMLLQADRDGGTPGAAVESAGSEDVRTMLAEVRGLWREELKGTLKDINWRFAEMEALRKSMEAGLQSMQEASEESAQANYGMLETMREDVKRFGKATGNVEKMVARLEAIEKRLKAVEDRPAQIIRETILKGGGGPAPTKDTGPKRPTLPTGPKKDPAVVAREIAAARKGLASEDVDELFPAIEKIRQHRVMDAVPRLIEILQKHKDEFGRTAAASALGDMKVADAVLALAEALVDKSDLVASQANQAIRHITEFDTGLGPSDGIRRRRTARNKVKEWWRDHEAAVRTTLGQPKAGG
ncbi:MAG: HEAT repeat domain-containing protein [Planctomycetota bacterium]|nr:HEAT repeat domain-containing protein [Planctomycetota bacterium]